VLTRFQAEQLLAGKTNGFVFDNYKILEQLGQGGMARVFKAEHQTMGRVVALKILSPKYLRTERARELFKREIRAAGMLIHPHIVTAFDAHEINGHHYLVQEYINGPNLDLYVREKGSLPVNLACDFIRQAALGLAFAHEMGMVHRDVKPANLLLQVNDDGMPVAVKVTDFGLARLNEPNTAAEEQVGTIMTKSNTVMGTPDFLSPEQARSLHQTDTRSDMYSLGCTLYYLLTRRVPFPGGPPLEKLLRHNSEHARPIREIRPEVPEEVAAIVEKLMAKNPEDRYQTPADLIEALRPFVNDLPGPGPVSRRSSPRPMDLADPLPTPFEFDDASSQNDDDDSAALIGTLPPDLTPTPVSILDGSLSSTRLAAELRKRQKRQRQLALYLTLGILGALLALAGILTVVLSLF
jgi:serine/threonine protein kinase